MLNEVKHLDFAGRASRSPIRRRAGRTTYEEQILRFAQDDKVYWPGAMAMLA
jgi:hypothetical protein